MEQPAWQEGPGPVGEPYRPNATFAAALLAKQRIDQKMWPKNPPRGA